MSLNVVNANICFLDGDFTKIIELLKYEDHNRPKVLDLLGISYFALGDIEKAYKTYNHLYTSDDVYSYQMPPIDKTQNSFNYRAYSLLKGIELFFEELPQINYDMPQSLENVDRSESYPETLEFLAFYKKYKNKELINKFLKIIGHKGLMNTLTTEIKNLTNSDNNIESAKGNFYAAEYFFRSHDYQVAFDYYLKSIHKNPNKSLIYGYAGNCAFKMKKYVLEGCILNNKAIQLDPKNSRWYFYQGLLCILLGSQLSCNLLYIGAKIHFEKALEVIRPEQISLKKAILKVYNKEF